MNVKTAIVWRRVTAGFGVCLWGGLAVAQDVAHEAGHLAALIAANPYQEEVSCAYVTTRSNEDGEQVEAFDSVWRLVSIDGRAPTEGELDDYAGGAAGREDRKHPASLNLAEVITPGTLALEEAGEDGREYSFTMRAEDEEEEDFLAAMDARLWTAADGRVRRVRMTNREPVSPQTGVRINQFEQDMRFGWDTGLSLPLLQSVHVKLEGRAFLVKKLDQDQTIRFSDIRCRSTL